MAKQSRKNQGTRHLPNIMVVGLGPAGANFLTKATKDWLCGDRPVFFRTNRHPVITELFSTNPNVAPLSFDDHYESQDTFEKVYEHIVSDLVAAAKDSQDGIVYGVPGSPCVAERTVELLRKDKRVSVTVIPAVSFLDLAWDRLGIDPLATSVRFIDGTQFANQVKGASGALLVAQCWSKAICSEIKLTLRDAVLEKHDLFVTVLHHLGLDDEEIYEVEWNTMDRGIQPDHLTAIWIPSWPTPLGSELEALDELAHRLRAECPWDKEQTHTSLLGYLIEETYEVVDAIEGLDTTKIAEEKRFEHLEEELGDLLFQVYFHATLAEEVGHFTLGDVAAAVRKKLTLRHPHVFGDVVANDPKEVASNWELIKKTEKGRESVTDGIPNSLPALAYAHKLLRRARSTGAKNPDRDILSKAELRGLFHDWITSPKTPDLLGSLLFAICSFCGTLETSPQPEEALRAANRDYVRKIRQSEGLDKKSS